jgi:hypothetical protein
VSDLSDNESFLENRPSIIDLPEGRVTMNKKEKLPGGVYYYTLKYKDKKSNIHNKAGYLYLNSTRSN